MPNFFHSGIEAYCKSVTQLVYSEDSSANWLKVCQDLMPDRTSNTISRVWTLSNERGGRSCRQSIFEQNWLSNFRASDYVDDAIAFAKYIREAKRDGWGADQVDIKQFKTIYGDIEYIRTLIFSSNNSERKAHAYNRCAQLAIGACVEDIVAKTIKALRDIKADMPAVALMVCDADILVKFNTDILANVERAFLAEPYLPADARQFGLTVNGLLEKAHLTVNAEDPERTDFQPFKDFLVALIAGLIYGPTHPLALGFAGNSTQWYDAKEENVRKIESKALRITQIFDGKGAVEGFSQTLSTSQLVFLGRSGKVSDFTDRCNELFARHKDIKKVIDEREILLFPISEAHAAVGNVHGMIIFEGGSWRYYDLETKNGTSIQSNGQAVEVYESVRLRPGDHIRLGAPKTANDSKLYWGATVLRISRCVELES